MSNPIFNNRNYGQFLSLMLMLVIFGTSCVAPKATAKRKRNLNYGQVEVTPSWQYKETAGSKMTPLAVGAIGASAAYFGNIEYNYDGQKYNKNTNALIFGLGGALLTAWVKASIVQSKKRKRRDYIRSDRDRWIKSYNKVNKYDFVINKENKTGTLVLYPKGTTRLGESDVVVVTDESPSRRPSKSKRKPQTVPSTIPAPSPSPTPTPSVPKKQNRVKYLNWSPYAFFEGEVYPSFVIGMAGMNDDTKSEKDLGDISSALGFKIKNSGSSASFTLEIIPTETKYIGAFKEKKTFAYGETLYFPVLPWKYMELKNLKTPTYLNFTFKITDEYGNEEQTSKRIRMKSINDCILSYRLNNGKTMDFTFLFAAYVNENHSEIDKILREAIDNKWTRSWSGYQADSVGVVNQVYAVWRVLQKRDIVYGSITDTEGSKKGLFTQHVRSFSDAIDNRQANCVDGSIVIASILKKIGIDANIILIPGHAFIEFIVPGKDGKGRRMFLETTMLQSEQRSKMMRSNFDKATRQGMLSYLKNYEKMTRIDINDARAIVKPIGN